VLALVVIEMLEQQQRRDQPPGPAREVG